MNSLQATTQPDSKKGCVSVCGHECVSMCEEGVCVRAKRDRRCKGTDEREIPSSADASPEKESGHS